jgi:antitoxin MazE
MAMKTRIVRIGNSQGVRLPRPLIELAGLGEDVVLQATPGRILIEAARPPRAGWAAAAKAMREVGDDGLLDAPTATRFDREDWVWR